MRRSRGPAGADLPYDRTMKYVALLRARLAAKHAVSAIVIKEGVDSLQAGDGVVYMSTLIARASQSNLSKIVAKPIYGHMTVRNFTTCQKILALMDGPVPYD